MKNFIKLVFKLSLVALFATFVLLVGIVFTTVMFPSDQYPDDLGRTWQDTVLIVFVFTMYAVYTIKVVVDHFKGK